MQSVFMFSERRIASKAYNAVAKLDNFLIVTPPHLLNYVNAHVFSPKERVNRG